MTQVTGIPTWPDLQVFYNQRLSVIVLEVGAEALDVPLHDAYVLLGQLKRAIRKCEQDSGDDHA